MENIKKHMENIMRRTNIYLIRPPQGENGDNRAKRQHVERNNGYEFSRSDEKYESTDPWCTTYIQNRIKFHPETTEQYKQSIMREIRRERIATKEWQDKTNFLATTGKVRGQWNAYLIC